MSPSHHKKLFYVLLVSGVVLVIAGIFITPLIPVGAALIAAAVAVGEPREFPPTQNGRLSTIPEETQVDIQDGTRKLHIAFRSEQKPMTTLGEADAMQASMVSKENVGNLGA